MYSHLDAGINQKGKAVIKLGGTHLFPEYSLIRFDSILFSSLLERSKPQGNETDQSQFAVFLKAFNFLS